MRSGITRRWLRGNLLITVLLVLLAEAMFLYSYTRSYYNSVQQTMYRRFSSVTGQLKVYTADTVYSAAANRSMALRRMVEQYSDKDKYEFMLLDSYGGVIASSSGTTMLRTKYRPDIMEKIRMAATTTRLAKKAFWICRSIRVRLVTSRRAATSSAA